MGAVLSGFASLAVVVLLGYLLARKGILGQGADQVLSRLAFFAAAPSLLFTTLSGADVSAVLSRGAVVTVSTSLAMAVLFAVLARLLLRLRGAELTLATYSASYVNAGNLGIPILVLAVGDATAIAPVLLLQLLVMVPVGFAILDRQTGREGVSWSSTVLTTVANPMVIAVALGLTVALTGLEIPEPVMMPIRMVADMAVPIMLVALGLSLRGSPVPGGGDARGPLWLAVVVKCAVAPAFAYLLAGPVLGLEGDALLGPVIVASLPTAQNIFVYAMRYGRAVPLVREAILITSVISVVVVVGLTAVLG